MVLTLAQRSCFCKSTRVTSDYRGNRRLGEVGVFDRLRAYCSGSETCSCTISHLPSWFSNTPVQRMLVISILPAFVVISLFTVAVAQTKSPWGWMARSSFKVNFALL